jgi:hypothetical protein
MDFVEMYYSEIVGSYPTTTDEFRIKSQKIIDYLYEAGVPENSILKFIETAPAQNYLTPDILPEWLWDNSLLSKDSFYYHNTLQITSRPPSFNPITRQEIVYPFFIEMKIVYTMEQLIRYFYRTTRLDIALIDMKRDSASFKYLLDKYQKSVSFVEPIDFILSLIDYAKDIEDNKISNIFDIKNNEQEVYKMLENKVAQASLEKVNSIVWR